MYIETIFGLFAGVMVAILLFQCYRLSKKLSQQRSALQRCKNLLAYHERRDLAIEDLLDQQKEEFDRLARKINDHVGGMIVSALIYLQHLFKPHPEGLNQEYEELEKLMMSACDEARSIAHQTMPEALFHLGLREAIEDLVLNLQNEHTMIQTHFRGMETLHLKKHTTWMLFLTIKELLQHLISKADINQVEFRFSYEQGKACMYFLDDASESKLDSMSPEQLQQELKRIQSKINYLGGEMNFKSQDQHDGNHIAIQFAA